MSDPWAYQPPATSTPDPWAMSSGSAPAQPEQPAPAAPPPPSAEEFMAGGGIKGFSFKGTPPMRLGGQVVEEAAMVQKRDFDSKKPMFWGADNKPTQTPTDRPIWVLVVKCQTDLRDTDDDDGIRAHYIEYNKRTALVAALKPHGVAVPAMGSHVYINYEAPEPPAGKPKHYNAEYYPPGVTPPSAPPAVAAAPGWAAPPPTAAQSGPPPAAQIAMNAGASAELARDLLAAGMTEAEARKLPTLAPGWQGAPAAQILPYLRQAPVAEPPF